MKVNRLIVSTVIMTHAIFLSNPAFSQVSDQVTSTPSTISTPTPPANPSGNYACTGTDATDKSEYVGDLIITQTGDTYNFKWVETKGDKFNGTGIFAKNFNNILAVEFWSPHNEKKSGILIYQVHSDGSLIGTWAWADKTEVGSEICRKQK